MRFAQSRQRQSRAGSPNTGDTNLRSIVGPGKRLESSDCLMCCKPQVAGAVGICGLYSAGSEAFRRRQITKSSRGGLDLIEAVVGTDIDSPPTVFGDTPHLVARKTRLACVVSCETRTR